MGTSAAEGLAGEMEIDAYRRLFPLQFYERHFVESIRPDSRKLGEARDTSVALGAVVSADGSAMAKIGHTTMLAGIKLEVMSPLLESPDEGSVAIDFHMPPICSPIVRPGRPAEVAPVISQQLSDVILSSGMLDLKELSLVSGKAAWMAYLDIYCLDADGSLFDAALLSAVAAFSHLQIPPVSLDEDGRVVFASDELPDGKPRKRVGNNNVRKLTLTNIPFSLTCILHQKYILADPTAEEESIMESLLTVVLDSSSRLVSLYKPGGTVLAYTSTVKEGARLEAMRRRMCETRKQDPTLSQWAEALGMKQVTLEKMLWRTRECSKRIIMSYRRLVFSIASTYQGRGLSLQDLVQEGNIGLLRGAERFDHRKGYKLSTYVYWWIKQSIIKAIAVKSRTVRLPGSTCGAVAKIAEATTLLSKKLGRVPSYDEVSDLVGIGVSRVRLVSERSRNPVSIDQPFTTDGNITLKDIIPGPEERSLEAMVTREFMKEDVEGLLKTLSKREERIVRLYFGFDGETARSCEEIGRLLKLSRERVRQLHCSALTKLREHSMTDGLRQLYMVQQ